MISEKKLIPVRIKGVSGAPHLAWAEGMQFCLPHTELENSRLIDHIEADSSLVIPPTIPEIPAEIPESLRFRVAFTEQKPISSRLPISYQYVPPRLRSFLATAVGRWKRRGLDGEAAFPRWPLDLSVDFLADLASGRPSPLLTGPTPVVLTHDLDSREGMEHLAKWFLAAEESVGASSSNYVVPCAYPIDYTLLDEIKERGHELGIHGYDHSNRTAFSDPAERRKRLEAGRELVDRYGIIGYRAPSLLRTRGLLRDLADFYRYDTSIPTSGGLFPIPNNGCASARPFWVEGIAELPISLPRDGSLLFMGYPPQQILDLWIRCADDVARSGGVVVLLVHCESRFSGNPAMRDVYRRFLDFVASSNRFAWSTPRQVLEKALGAGFHA